MSLRPILAAAMLLLAPGLAADRFLDYVAWVRADRRRGSFGSTALGSSTHFFGLQLGDAFGIELEPVGYRGAAPLISDLAAGHIAAGCGGVSDFLTHHKDGKLRIAITSGPRRGITTPEATAQAVGLPVTEAESLINRTRVRPGDIEALRQAAGRLGLVEDPGTGHWVIRDGR